MQNSLPSSKLGGYFANLVGWMNGAGVVWVFALMFLICADIIGRTVFDSPIRGVTEIVSLSLVACVFLQIAYAIHQTRLTLAEVLINRLEQRNAVLDHRVERSSTHRVGVLLHLLGEVEQRDDDADGADEFSDVSKRFQSGHEVRFRGVGVDRPSMSAEKGTSRT